MQTRTHRVPFLLHRPPKLCSVKKSPKLPPEVIPDLIMPNTEKSRTMTQSIHYQNSTTNCSSNSNINLVNSCPVEPMTLSAMAGIQLTGADVSATDMSGVVPMATTVEEINIPVFINERLQEGTPTTSTTTKTSAANNYICNNSEATVRAAAASAAKETETTHTNVCIGEDDLLVDLGLDIDLIVNSAACVDQSQQDDLIASLLFNNNNNNTTATTNTKVSNNNNNDMLNTLLFKSEPHINQNDDFDIMQTIDAMHLLKKEFDVAGDCCVKQQIQQELKDEEFIEQQYRLLPGVLEDSQITYIDENELDILGNIPEDAVSFEDRNIPELSDVLINSQENPLLGACINNSQTFQPAFSQLLSEEPVVPEFDDDEFIEESCNYISKICSMKSNKSTYFLLNDDDDDSNLKNTTTKTIPTPIKRVASQNNHNNMQKRRKLRLDVSDLLPATEDITLKTPDIVNLIAEMRDDESNCILYSPQSPAELLNDLIKYDNENIVSPDTTGIILDESPNTPLSVYSTSQVTNSSDYTAPNSPALSTTSTNTTSLQSSSNKRRRGRPAKQHSDRPSPSLLKQLSETDRKRLEDRAKNNEASRLSRQKNKQREVAEIEEEMELQTRNNKLVEQLAQTERLVRKLKHALQQKYLET